MVKGTSYQHMNQVPNKEEIYETLLSENVIGVIHDRYITFHLDLDVDGPDSSCIKVNLARQATNPVDSPRMSYLKATREVAKTEKDAQIQLSPFKPKEFHVINPLKTSRIGNPVGYKVVPAGTTANLLDPQDPPQIRGTFTKNQTGATLRTFFTRHELYALSGTYTETICGNVAACPKICSVG